MNEVIMAQNYAVYPTRVGMNRDGIGATQAAFGIPHASGDEPPDFLADLNAGIRIPHASGDEPMQPASWGLLKVYTPREWG